MRFLCGGSVMVVVGVRGRGEGNKRRVREIRFLKKRKKDENKEGWNYLKKERE